MGYTSYIPQVLAKLDMAATRAFTRIGMDVQGEIRKSMKAGKRIKGKRVRRAASRVGTPPNVQTGTLRRDIGYDVTKGLAGNVRVGTNTAYGAEHELSRTRPRPFIKPAIIGRSEQARKLFIEELSRL